MLKFVLFVACIVAANCSDVLELGDSDFDSTLKDLGLTLVKFYAPWCGHCKKLAPEFDRAAAVLKSNDPPVPLVKVDCTAEGKDVCGKHGVSGYPTLKAFKNGELAFDYQGPRDADGIVKYMKSKAGPSAKNLEDGAAVDKYLAKSDHVVVGFFDKEDSDLHKQFMKVADSLNEDFNFGYTFDKDSAKKHGHKNEIVIFRPKAMASKFEESEVVYDGDVKMSPIKSWVNDNIHGLAGHRTTTNQEQFKKPLVVAYYEVDYVRNAKGTNYWRNRVMKIGQKLQEGGLDVHFAISNKEDFSHELTEFGMASDKDAPVVAARDSKDKKYVMTEDFSMESFEKFVRAFLNGEIEAYLKSEAVPSDNTGPVKTIVAKNFEEIVNDPTKDVLIEFYAPWCGHCKTLAPKFEELGEAMDKEESIVIAKMDATANDVPKQFEVSGFPTLYFVPKGSKNSPQKYNGGREVDEFIKYLAKESSTELNGWDRSGKKSKKQKKEL